MSTKNKHIDKEVEKTMESMDGMERATTDDFYYSRLSAKLENRHTGRSEDAKTPEFGFAFSVAAVFIVLVLNVMYLSEYIGTEDSTEREIIVEELATDYQVFDLNYYETFEEE
jgi:hypothetical protein